MIRTWLRTLVKKALSGKALRPAPRPFGRRVRPHLEALEERMATSITALEPAWLPIPIAIAVGAAAIASHGAGTQLPSPTAPAGEPGAGLGTPGWEGLLRDVSGIGAPGSATAPGPPTDPPSSAFRPFISLPHVEFTVKPFSVADASPPAVGMARLPADPSFVPPPSADRAENRVAQPPMPEPAARTEKVGPEQEPDRSNGAGNVLAPRHDRPPTPAPQNRARENAQADFPVATPLVDDRVPNRNRGKASIPAAAEPERLRAPVSDGALLRRYVRYGDQAAFRAIVQQHDRVVLGTCRRVLGDPHLAQEAFQTTFMVLARKAATLDARRPLTGWLCQVAFRAALRLRAAAARRRRHEQQAARPSTVSTSLSADLEKKEIFQALAEELQRLPEKYRVPLALCYFDGRTHGDAAQLMGLPRGSMAKRIREGLFRLRERLVTRGFTV